MFINEEFFAEKVEAEQLDRLLAAGWRHFGTTFYRYSLAIYGADIRRVIPLRIRLANFSPSKSQRRVLNRNSDLQIAIQPIEITDETCDLFERHKQRFKFGIPDSIYDFISGDSEFPCDSFEMSVRLDDRLVAASYFDVAMDSISAIYGMFDPDFPSRSLGIFTMLKEIEFATLSGKEFYYQGYAYEGESFYDYKKRFRSTESFDWRGNWELNSTFKNLAADDADKAD
ncbi:MAG: arginine-tRNA-protein transferase [Acidobacteria bacterium]|nr:MAG: arginine-tRNA-protein transferase [Acidobacteriota bacterium]